MYTNRYKRSFKYLICAGVFLLFLCLCSSYLFAVDESSGDYSQSWVEQILDDDAAMLSPWLLMMVFVVGTFVSEDLTCITAGILSANGIIGYIPAVFASLTGIFIGDVILFCLGRYLGRSIIKHRPFRWFLSQNTIESSEAWFQHRGPMVILISRFIPGSRLPVYVASGILNMPLRKVVLYFAVAGLLWTPVIVWVAAKIGKRTMDYLDAYGELTRYLLILVAFVIWLLIKLIVPQFTYRGRRLFIGRWRRRLCWEFWPEWLFQIPVVGYMTWLGVKYHSCTLFTCVNPAIPEGGVIGESKTAILDQLQSDRVKVAPYQLLNRKHSVDEQLGMINAFMQEHQLVYPVVLKPDQGQRGEGVAIMRSDEQMIRYLSQSTVPVMVQAYIPGIEFGVFYYRYPDKENGKILSITEKRMPYVVGDGEQTLEHLILKDERAVCMADFFLAKNSAREFDIIPEGEKVMLVEVGTHCRGALFFDGVRAWTPMLERAIDEISRTFKGFYFGRYDIIVPSLEHLRAGQDLTVIELNGVTSIATDIYDPAHPLSYAYRRMFEQWRIAFEIGDQHRSHGCNPASLYQLFKRWQAFQRASEAEIG